MRSIAVERQRRRSARPRASSTPAVAPAMISRVGAERRREMRRERVGVDVQQLALRVDADAGDRPARSRAAAGRASSDASAPSGWPTRPRSTVSPATRRERRGRDSTSPMPAVRAGQPDRASAGSADRRDERGVGPPGEHRDDRVERGGIGDPQAVDERWRRCRARAARRRSRGRRHGPRPAAAVAASARRSPPRARSHAGCILEQLAAELEDAWSRISSAPSFRRTRTRR